MPDGPERPSVAFNAALLSPTADYRSAGIHQHILGLVGALALRVDLNLRVLSSGSHDPDFLPAGIDVQRIPKFTSRPTGRVFWEQLVLPFSLMHRPVDLVHCPAYSVPVASPVPAVVTIHDLSFHRIPEVLPGAKGAYLRAATRVAALRAAALIAVSDFTRREILEVLGVDESRVFVVPNGVGSSFRPVATAAATAFADSAGLPPQYLLSVGTVEPRKNLGTLLTAYAELRRRRPDAPTLVVAGAPGWGRNDLTGPMEALGLGDHVLVTGHVSDHDLPSLYSGAKLFVFPSRYEGFGLPVLEAMACGTPVVSSSSASLPEVVGEAGLLVEPDDVSGWADAMEHLLDNAARRDELIHLGLARSEGYTWARTAAATAAVYRHVLRAGQSRAQEPVAENAASAWDTDDDARS